MRPLTGAVMRLQSRLSLAACLGGAVDGDRAFELLDQRGLGVDVLPGDGVLPQQRAVALQRDARGFELRLVALARAARPASACS
jgi:hypothetical protein